MKFNHVKLCDRVRLVGVLLASVFGTDCTIVEFVFIVTVLKFKHYITVKAILNPPLY